MRSPTLADNTLGLCGNLLASMEAFERELIGSCFLRCQFHQLVDFFFQRELLVGRPCIT